MGKKIKKNSKQAWKKSEAAKEYEETIAKVHEDEIMKNKEDSALFFEDKKGSNRVRKVLFEDEVSKDLTPSEKKRVLALKKKMAKGISLEQKKGEKRTIGDLWEVQKPKQYDSMNFLREDDLNRNAKKSKKPREIQVPTKLEAVPIPKAGTSYNPDTVQQQDAIAEQMAIEVKATEKSNEDKVLPGGLTLKELHSQTIRSDILYSSLLFDEEPDKEKTSLSKDVDSDEEEPVYNKPTVDKKKSSSQRRRNALHRLRQAQLEKEKQERKVILDAERSKSIAKQIEREEKQKEEEKKQKEELKKLLEEKKGVPLIRGGSVVYP